MAVVRVRPLFKGIGIKNGPGILLHIFTAVCIHCLRIIFQESVEIAVHQFRPNTQVTAFYFQDFFYAGFPERIAERRIMTSRYFCLDLSYMPPSHMAA